MFGEQFVQSFGVIWSVLSVLNSTALFWLPILIGIMAWHLWMSYVRADFIANTDWHLLEIKLPKEILKSPLAMEVLFATLFQKSTGTWLEHIWDGRIRLWFSLEMVSFGGQVKFFIRTPAKFKNIVEAQIYAQFPGIEISEVPDYTLSIHADDGWSVWGTEFALTKPDPFPIKTYVDYGMDKQDLKEEFRIDPMSPMIEYLGSMNRDEQVWVQILVQATGSRFRERGSFLGLGKQDWKAEGKDLVEKMLGSGENRKKFMDLSKGDQEIIASIERNTGKLGFDCGMRALYLGKSESFNGFNIPALLSVVQQYNSANLNGFTPVNDTSFDYPWQDYKDKRLNKKKREMFDAYKRRSYFFSPYKRRPFVLSTEELATIYHFPGKISEAPGFTRIESRKVEPPANLPV